MPIYEYQCSKCGNVFEVLQKFSDAPIRKHAKCGGTVKKLISRSGFQLKGGGWYATDYAPAGAKKEDKSTETKSESSTTESKPAADSKAAESKSSESKASESKTSTSKAESKPASKSKKD